MADESTARVLPGSYSEMYPGRFLKADMLKGKKVTVTILKIMGEDLIGENNKAKSEWIVKIKERPLELVLNKTNGYCIMRMFGSDPHAWLEKRITIYPTTTKFGRETLDCIRIWGSPDIAEDLEITVPQGRKKPWETVMHKTGTPTSTNGAATPPAAPAANQGGLDPRIAVAFGLLGWDAVQQSAFIVTNLEKGQPAMIAELNRLLDEVSANQESAA